MLWATGLWKTTNTGISQTNSTCIWQIAFSRPKTCFGYKCKWWRPSWDAAECCIWSESTTFAYKNFCAKHCYDKMKISTRRPLKIHPESHCSASRGLRSNTKQGLRVINFSIHVSYSCRCYVLQTFLFTTMTVNKEVLKMYNFSI